jgi:hypothetical protein
MFGILPNASSLSVTSPVGLRTRPDRPWHNALARHASLVNATTAVVIARISLAGLSRTARGYLIERSVSAGPGCKAPGRRLADVILPKLADRQELAEYKFEKHILTCAPSRIRTCAHGSGDRVRPRCRTYSDLQKHVFGLRLHRCSIATLPRPWHRWSALIINTGQLACATAWPGAPSSILFSQVQLRAADGQEQRAAGGS